MCHNYHRWIHHCTLSEWRFGKQNDQRGEVIHARAQNESWRNGQTSARNLASRISRWVPGTSAKPEPGPMWGTPSLPIKNLSISLHNVHTTYIQRTHNVSKTIRLKPTQSTKKLKYGDSDSSKEFFQHPLTSRYQSAGCEWKDTRRGTPLIRLWRESGFRENLKPLDDVVCYKCSHWSWKNLCDSYKNNVSKTNQSEDFSDHQPEIWISMGCGCFLPLKH